MFEVLLEKGIAPTPMQELMINTAKVFLLDMGLKAFSMQQQIKSVLTQLISMKTQPQKVSQQAPTTPSQTKDSYEDFDDVYEDKDLDSPVVESEAVVINTMEDVSETEV